MTDTGDNSIPAVTMEPAKLFRRIPLAPHQLLDPLTPQRDVFVLAHLGLPRFDARHVRLEIAGLVRKPVTLSMDEVRALPRRSVQAFHQCAGFPRQHWLPTRRVANAVWTGADLAALLADVGVLPEARYLWSYGIDRGRYEEASAPHYVKDMPLARLPGGDVILAYEINGEPLDIEHGYPLRLFIPGYYGTNSVKWLTRLELAATRAASPFTTTFYNDPVDPAGTRPVWEIAPESVIVSPAPDAQVAGPTEIWGWAWADGGVAAVEVSTDGGASWQPAELAPQVERAWQRFTYSWRPQRSGAAVLASRATARGGATQPDDGARNCVYRVPVSVTV